MGLNHSNSEWYNPNVMFVFLRIAWARSPVSRKEMVLTAFIYSFIILIKAGSMFNFFQKWAYPKGGGGVLLWILVEGVQPISPNPDPISEPPNPTQPVENDMLSSQITTPQ